jgi:hypothetical protein
MKFYQIEQTGARLSVIEKPEWPHLHPMAIESHFYKEVL